MEEKAKDSENHQDLKDKVGVFKGLSNELISDLSLFCSVEAVGRMMQTCQFFNLLLRDDFIWKRRIKTELTSVPQLVFGKSHRENYEIMYDFMMRNDVGPFCPNTDDSNYKSFIIGRTTESRDPETVFSLESFLISASILGAEIWVEKLIALGANLNITYYSCTPLMFVVDRNHFHLFELLIMHGADINLYYRDPDLEPGYCTVKTVYHCALLSNQPVKWFNTIFRVLRQKKLKINGKLLPIVNYFILTNNLGELRKALASHGAHSRVDIAGFTPLA